MEITLLPETAQRIRATLESDVDLSPAAVPAALSRLAVEAPAVYSQVLAELSGSQIRLDSERELRRRHRRGLVRRALFGWGEYRSDAGDRLIAKRRLAAAVPFGLACVLLILWGVSATMGHHPVPPPARADVGHETTVAGDHSGSSRLPGSAWATQFLRPVPITVLPVPRGRGSVAALIARPPLPRALPVSPGNPVVFDRQQAPDRLLPARLPASGVVTPAPVVYDRVANEGGTSLRDASVLTENAAGPAHVGPQWKPGQRIAAHLATGIVVAVGGPPMPVIAESDGAGATWLGQATLGAEGLVQVTFTLASPRRQGDVHGVALDPDRLVPGLAGRMTLRHPHTAAVVMAAALQAVGDYMQALARQGEATLTDGWAQLTLGQPAPGWTYAASRLAQVLDPGAGAGGAVETMEITSGSRLTILVTGAP